MLKSSTGILKQRMPAESGKENSNPNLSVSTENLIQGAKQLKELYNEKFDLTALLNHNNCPAELADLIQQINDQHSTNRKRMNTLLNSLLEKCKHSAKSESVDQPCRDSSVHQIDDKSVLRQRKSRMSTRLTTSVKEESAADFVERVLEQISGAAEQLPEQYQEMDFMELVDSLSEVTGFSLTELYCCFDIVKLFGRQHLLQLLETGVLNEPRLLLQDPLWYLQTDVAELAFTVIAEKISALDEDCVQLDECLCGFEIALVQTVLKYSGATAQQILEDPSLIVQLYPEVRDHLILHDSEKNKLVDRYRSVFHSLNKHLAETRNYQSLIESKFKACPQEVTYRQLSDVLEKDLKLLSQAEVSILFRYQHYAQNNTYTEIVDRNAKININTLLDQLLQRLPAGQQDNQKDQLLSQLKANNQDLAKRVQAYKAKVQDLEHEKKVIQQESQRRQNEFADQLSKDLRRQVAEETEMGHKMKLQEQEMRRAKQAYEANIRRLETKLQNQQRIMEAYRAQLENIMSEMHR